MIKLKISVVRICLFCSILLLSLWTNLSASVRLPGLIGDCMVLQRGVELKIWGWADKGEKITVRFNGEYYYTETGVDGKWMVRLPEQRAGGPYIMEINDVILRDILIGDVWLCSGQSNMETPIERLVEKYPEINVSNNHMIRYFKVPTQNTIEYLQQDIPRGSRWYSGVASEVMNWTALAYFYAKESYEYNGIPVGILVSSLGGSMIESWISQEHMKDFPALLVDFDALNAVRELDVDQGAGNFTVSHWDDSQWETVKLPGQLRSQGLHNRGVTYFRKNFTVSESGEGRHAKLYLGTLIDSDSVFVNGHFVGSTSYAYPPRKYNIPAGVLRAGNNNITVRLRANGNAEFVVGKPYKVVGDDFEVNLIGEWRYRIGINIDASEEFRSRLQNLRSSGSGLYNGMIYPIRDYQVMGVIWYQGESNTGQGKLYSSYLKALIANWREVFDHPELPFLLVQLPNFMMKCEQPSESDWAAVRESQFKVAKELPNTALAVTYDIGEWNDIHPLNKKDMAKRLLLGARNIAYGEKIVSSGPMYKGMTIDGDKIILEFTNVGSGLISRGKEGLQHFAIAGEDKKFVWADAVIKKNTVVVSAKNIKQPIAVRYAWSDNPEDANLSNKDGLLASPFRTDQW